MDIYPSNKGATGFRSRRRLLQSLLSREAVAVYDVFPLNAALEPAVRTIAGQFLAAEALWALEEGGHLGGVPINLKLNVPRGWDRNPKTIHEKLLGAGALELTAEAIDTFNVIKGGWDATPV